MSQWRVITMKESVNRLLTNMMRPMLVLSLGLGLIELQAWSQTRPAANPVLQNTTNPYLPSNPNPAPPPAAEPAKLVPSPGPENPVLAVPAEAPPALPSLLDASQPPQLPPIDTTLIEQMQKILNNPFIVKTNKIMMHPEVWTPLMEILKKGNFKFLAFLQAVLLLGLLMFRYFRLKGVTSFFEWALISVAMTATYTVGAAIVVPWVALGKSYGQLLKGLLTAYHQL